MGEIHSNIDSEPAGIEVVDEFTRERLGTVGHSNIRPASLAVGGRGLSVVHSDGERLYVAGPGAPAPPAYPVRPSPCVGPALARAFRRHLRVQGEGPFLLPLGHALAIVHFAGSVASLLLGRWLLRQDQGEPLGTRGLALRFRPTTTRPIALPDRRDLERLVDDSAPEIARLMGTGPFGKHVPRAEWIAWVRGSVDLEALAAAFLMPLGGPGQVSFPEGIAYL
jgi:hypothetical protein